MNRNLLLVTISLCLWGIGEGFFIYFQPLYLQELGADPILIGTVFGAMGIAMAVAQVPTGYLSDRFGSRSIMWLSWILGSVAGWTMALANGLPAFIVGLILYGLTGFVVAPMNSYITTVRGKYSVGRALAIPSGFYSLGAVLGPILGGLVADKLELRSVYFLAGTLFVISTIVIFFVQKHPESHHSDLDSAQPRGLLKNTRFLGFLAVTLITLFAIYLPQPFTPSFLQNQQQLSRTTIGILGAFGSLGSAVAMLSLSHLKPLTGFFVAQAWLVLFSLLFLFGKSTFWFGLGYFFIGGYRLCRVMVLAIARTLIHPKETGLAYGLVETMSSVTVILAPVLAGFLYRNDPYSIYRVSLVLLVIVMAANLLVFSTLNKRKVNADVSAN